MAWDIEKAKKMAMKLEDTFEFTCTACGKCCRRRTEDDILMTPVDIFRIAKSKNMGTQEFIRRFGKIVPGGLYYLPAIVAQFVGVGKTRHCIFLNGKKCSIHAVKPSVCALHPLGRYYDPLDKAFHFMWSGGNVCGRGTGQMFLVKDWLDELGYLETDPAACVYYEQIAEMNARIHQLAENKTPVIISSLESIMQLIFGMIYYGYDMDKDFLPQITERMADAIELLDALMPGALLPLASLIGEENNE